MNHLQVLWAALIKKREFHLPTRAHLVHSGEHFAHMVYLGAVSVEGHGMYAHAASALLVMVVLSVFTKEVD